MNHSIDLYLFKLGMQYGQSLSNAYSQPQNDHNTMFSSNDKDNALKSKIDREREDGNSIAKSFENYIEYVQIPLSMQMTLYYIIFNNVFSIFHFQQLTSKYFKM